MTDEPECSFTGTSTVFMSTLNSIILIFYSSLVLMQIETITCPTVLVTKAGTK